MKSSRQSAILEILSEQTVETQQQLMEALAARGLKSTQATLSRDIRELRIVKERGADGVYRYAVPENRGEEDLGKKLESIFKDSVESIECAQNLLVIHTLPGLAHAACSAVDSWRLEGVAGTLAGNDTVFLAARDPGAAQNVLDMLNEILHR